MQNFLVLITLILFTWANTSTVRAQSIVDPGVSVFNYKHPNKAAQAKSQRKEQHTIRVASSNTVEAYNKRRYGKYATNTPKYAPRPASLVLSRKYEVDGIELNPLRSERNYKTNLGPAGKRRSELADFHENSDKNTYPTVD